MLLEVLNSSSKIGCNVLYTLTQKTLSNLGVFLPLLCSNGGYKERYKLISDNTIFHSLLILVVFVDQNRVRKRDKSPSKPMGSLNTWHLQPATGDRTIYYYHSISKVRDYQPVVGPFFLASFRIFIKPK
jgi:hypothetical protein